MRRQENAAIEVAALDLGTDEEPGNSVWALAGRPTRNGRSLRIPLSRLARDILPDAIRDPARPKDLSNPDQPKDSRFVLTTTGTTPVSGFAKAKARLDRLMMKNRAEAAAKLGQEPTAMPLWTVHDPRAFKALIGSGTYGTGVQVIIDEPLDTRSSPLSVSGGSSGPDDDATD